VLKVSRDSHIKVAVGKTVVIAPAAWQRFCQSEVVICIRDAADMLSLQTVLHAVMQGICQPTLLLLIGSRSFSASALVGMIMLVSWQAAVTVPRQCTRAWSLEALGFEAQHTAILHGGLTPE